MPTGRSSGWCVADWRRITMSRARCSRPTAPRPMRRRVVRWSARSGATGAAARNESRGSGGMSAEQLFDAMVVRAHGGPEALVLDRVAVPPPGPGEVAIDVAAAGLNFPDLLVISGKYQ